MIKKIFFSAILLSNSAFASEQVVKECSTTLVSLDSDKKIDSDFKIFVKDDGSVYSKTNQTIDGVSGSYENVAEVEKDLVVREGLDENSNPDENNDAENQILLVKSLAKLLENEPAAKGKFDTGIDLDKVRSASVYVVGKRTHMGYAAIVEAKDESGNVLGSFFNGILAIAPCK